jgi:hypothetical protein
MLDSLCGEIIAEPDPLIRYKALTSEQAHFDALVSAIKRERGRALAELKAQGMTSEQVAEHAQLGTRQRVEKLIKTAVG